MTESYPRAKAPVFVVGSPRSGTTLLYHMLLSAGGFARFRAETHLFCSLGPRFGGLKSPADVEAALELWLDSDLHALSGLERDDVAGAIRRGTRSTGDFLRVIMDSMVAAQGATRWAETTPAHLLYMREIQEQIPGALFIHVIRDGRDVATSLARQGWIRPLPFDKGQPAAAAAAYWNWLVRRGREEGSHLGDAYLEVRYEQLVTASEETLREIGRFIEHRLEWDEIRAVGVGSVGRPNTSFPEAPNGYLARWRQHLSDHEAAAISKLLAPLLLELGYDGDVAHATSADWRRTVYALRFSAREALKRVEAVSRRATDLSNFTPGSLEVSAEKLEGVRAAAP